MPFGTELCLGQGHIVLDGDPAPSPPQGHSLPQFRPMSVVAKRLDIKMPLGPEVGLDPGHIVLYRDTPPPQRGTAPNCLL